MIVGVTGTQYDRIRGYPILGGCRSGGGGGIRLITVRSRRRRRRGGGGRILHGGDFPIVIHFCKRYYSIYRWIVFRWSIASSVQGYDSDTYQVETNNGEMFVWNAIRKLTHTQKRYGSVLFSTINYRY